MRTTLLRIGTVAAGGALLVAGCGLSDSAGQRPTPVAEVDGAPRVVVTYSVLGDIVRQLVGDAATVEVLIPNGQDPHDYEASARDFEQMAGAAMVVANGLGLEEGLVESIESIERDGVPVFRAADHVAVRQLGRDEPVDSHGDDEHGEDSLGEDSLGEDSHSSGDPHLWTDPLTMAAMVPDLGRQLSTVLGVDLAPQVTALESSMAELDVQVRDILSVVPAGRCTLVTGHDSLGYFAERYGCHVIGAVIPSLSSTATASAKDLAELLDVATEAEVGAIFTELGTPAQVAEQVADEMGVPLIELPTHGVPDAGGYEAFITQLATRIADGLAPV